MRAPVNSAYVVRFFQLVTQKQLTEAERELQRIKEKIERTEWNHGYFKALQGMLLSKRNNNDQNTFFTILDPNDKRALLDFRHEFQEKMDSRLYADYDRGYFSAWVDYVTLLKKMSPAESAPLRSPQPSQPNLAEDVKPQAQAPLTDWQQQTN